MPRTLDAYLHQDLVGQLIQDKHGQMAFRYAESWLNHPRAVPPVALAIDTDVQKAPLDFKGLTCPSPLKPARSFIGSWTEYFSSFDRHCFYITLCFG